MNRLYLITLVSALVTGLVLSACTAPPIILLPPESGTAQLTSSVVKTHRARGDVEIVPDSSSALMTNANGVTFTLNAAELIPGNVYTAWVVVINKPELCETSPCTGTDVQGNPDVVHSTITYGDGQIADESGRATFSGMLNKGPLPDGWLGYGLEDPLHAEIHVVLHDHRAPIEGMVDEMLATFRAGCTDESLPASFPAAAFADGTPGPNECIHYQSTIFQQ